MKKSIKNRLSLFLYTLVTVFLGAINVNASCTYQQKADLNEEARKVKTSYEITNVTKTVEAIDSETGERYMAERQIPEFVISIYNLTPNMYIAQTDSLKKETKDIFHFQAENGTYTFKTQDIENIITYTYKIYSNLDECRGDTLRSYTFVKPMANPVANYSICEGLADIPYCQPYITKPLNADFNQIDKAINDYLSDRSIKQKEEENENGFLDFLKGNYLYVILGVVIVGAGIGGAIYIIKKRSTL